MRTIRGRAGTKWRVCGCRKKTQAQIMTSQAKNVSSVWQVTDHVVRDVGAGISFETGLMEA